MSKESKEKSKESRFVRRVASSSNERVNEREVSAWSWRLRGIYFSLVYLYMNDRRS